MAIRTLSFFVFILLCSFLSQGQERPKDLEWYESFFSDNKKPIAANKIVALEKRVAEASNRNDLSAELKDQMELGMIHLTRSLNYELAMNCFIRSLLIEDSLKLKRSQIFTYLGLSELLAELGDAAKSIEMLESALEINRAENDRHILVFILLKIGKLEVARGDKGEALENYQNALKYARDLNDPNIRAEALFELGHLYSSQGKYAEALDSHKEALAIWRTLQDKKKESIALNDIGELYLLTNNPDKALANHAVALEIRQVLKDQKGVAQSYNNVAALYYKQNDFERAIANLHLGLDAAQDAQEQNQIRKSYELLAACFKELGDYKKSLVYKELQMNITDFIQNEKEQQSIIETQNLYVIEKQEAQIGHLEAIRIQREKELQQQKKFRNFLIAMVALGAVIALLISGLYIMKRRSNRVLKLANDTVKHQNLQLQELNTTKDKFFSIISHDLKGPLNSLSSFSGLLINHTDSLTKDEIRMLAQDLDKSLKNLFLLLENLLEWSRSQIGNMEFHPELFDLSDLLLQNQELLETQAKNKNIALQTRINGENIQINAHKHSVNTVVRNLISNAIKFTAPGGKIQVNAMERESQVVVSISDTGVGMSKQILEKLFRLDTKHSTKGTADEKGTGLGLLLCKDFIEKNGGKIWVESEPGKGSVFYFTFPSPAVSRKSESLYSS